MKNRKIEVLEKKISELEKENHLYKSIIKNLPYGIHVFDEDGNTFETNPRQQEILGLISNIDDKPINILKNSFATKNGVDKIYDKVYRGNSISRTVAYDFSQQENTHDTNKGKRIYREDIFPITNNDNHVEYIVTLLNDITKDQIDKNSLKQSEELFKNLFNSNFAVMLLIEKETFAIVEANEAAQKFYGWSLDKLTNMNICELNLLSAKKIQNEIEKKKKNSSKGLQLKHRLANGQIKDVEIFTNNIEHRGKTHYYWIIYDITGKKNFESDIKKQTEQYLSLSKKYKQQNEELRSMLKKVKASEQRLIEVQKIAKFGEWHIDLIEDIAYWSKSCYQLYGLDENIVGDELRDTLRSITHPDDLVKHIHVLNECKKGKPFENSYRISVGNEYKTMLSVGQPVYDDCNKVIAIQGYYQDITERQKYIDEIEKKNRFIQTVLDNLPIAVALNRFDEEEINYTNKKFEEIYGWKHSEIKKNNDFFNKVYPDKKYRNKIKALVKAGIESNNPESMRWNGITITQSDGSKRIINASNIPIYEQNQMVSTAVDVTEVKEYEQQLIYAKEKAEESDNLKTAFLQNMSHEIRTPMNGIMGFAELLKEPNLENSIREYYANIVIKSCNQLLSIVTDIITISTIETSQATLSIDIVDINEINRNMFELYNKKSKEKGIQLKISNGLKTEKSLIYTDETKLSQILTNIIGNAIKFTHHGFVEFGYVLKGDFLEFYVKDTGIGIAKEMHNSIFERFRQAEVSLASHYGGMGLGLSISKGLIELMGGSIRLASEPEKGSTFYFTLPYNQVSNNESKISNGNEQCTEDKDRFTILVAEDEEVNFLVLRELLSKFDIEIIRAINGQEALDICLTNKNINLILMDIKMPVVDGYTATKELRNKGFSTPIIAQTAYALKNEIKEFQDIFDGYLTKPINKEMFLETIRKYITNNKNSIYA